MRCLLLVLSMAFEEPNRVSAEWFMLLKNGCKTLKIFVYKSGIAHMMGSTFGASFFLSQILARPKLCHHRTIVIS